MVTSKWLYWKNVFSTLYCSDFYNKHKLFLEWGEGINQAQKVETTKTYINS